MVNAQRNPKCRDAPDTCFTCGLCGKHHEMARGAEACCGRRGYDESCAKVGCRHCKKLRGGA